MKFAVLILSLILALSISGSLVVFAGVFDPKQDITANTEIKYVEDLEAVTGITPPKHESYIRDDAEQFKTITFRGKTVETEYQYSNRDGLGNEYDVYRTIDKTNQGYGIYRIDKNNNIISFALMYTQDELNAFDDIKYLVSISTVKNENDAVKIANEYLENSCGVDLNDCKLLWARYMSYHLYKLAYSKKIGDFPTEEVYYIDVSVTGEIYGFSHTREPVPDALKVEAYTYESIEKRAIEDLATVFGDTYRSCVVNNILAVSYEKGDYFLVDAEVEYLSDYSNDILPWGYTLYYEIK